MEIFMSVLGHIQIPLNELQLILGHVQISHSFANPISVSFCVPFFQFSYRGITEQNHLGDNYVLGS